MPDSENITFESALALDDAAGHWVTISGSPVLIKDGMIAEGPTHLKGKSLEDAAKDGHHVTAVHGATKPQYTPEQGKALKAKAKQLMDKAAQENKHISISTAIAQAKKELAMSDNYILSLADTGEGKPLPLALSGLPTVNDAGEPIHYRKMLVARCGEWKHVGTGEPLPITRDRADEWVRNAVKLSSAGRQAFVPVKHDFDETPDASGNQGYVLNLAREGDDVYATVALHGDEALKIAAKNSRSIGIKRNPIDAKGNAYAGEWLHHLALVPNPALPNLGGMQSIAASADSAASDVPVFVLSAVSPTSAPSRKGHRMNATNAQLVRAKLGFGADVPDDQLDDKAAEKALALSESVATLTTERDAAKAEATAKASEVLALSADKRDIDPITLSMFSENIATKREMAIRSGAISEAEAKNFDAILSETNGQPARLALSACGPTKRPIGFQIWDAIAKLGGNGIRVGNAAARHAGIAEAEPTIALSDDQNEAIAKKARDQGEAWKNAQLAAQGK